MPSVNLYNISLAYGPQKIFENVSFSLTTKDRVALSGANGSGKTSLMKIIAGLINADSGEVIYEKNTRVSYLPQTGVSFGDISLYDEVEKAFQHIKMIIQSMKTLEEKLIHIKEDNESSRSLLAQHHNFQEKIEQSNYYNREEEIFRILTGLGFSSHEFEKKISSFSSGWQMRIALAKVLLEKPDIMLLDEPTKIGRASCRERV